MTTANMNPIKLFCYFWMQPHFNIDTYNISTQLSSLVVPENHLKSLNLQFMISLLCGMCLMN